MGETARSVIHWSLLAATAVVGVWILSMTLSHPSPGHILNLVLVSIAFVFLLIAKPKQADASCPACGSPQDPVRSPGGRRLWTCRACGAERPRRRSRKQIETGST